MSKIKQLATAFCYVLIYGKYPAENAANCELSPPQRLLLGITLGSLSNGDGNGNENGKKAIGLDWQNNRFARASRLFLCRRCTATT